MWRFPGLSEKELETKTKLFPGHNATPLPNATFTNNMKAYCVQGTSDNIYEFVHQAAAYFVLKAGDFLVENN